jgi:hypothetical protein
MRTRVVHQSVNHNDVVIFLVVASRRGGAVTTHTRREDDLLMLVPRRSPRHALTGEPCHSFTVNIHIFCT